MAGEIVAGLSIQFRGAQLINYVNLVLDQATKGRAGGFMNVTTGGITLVVGAVGTPGILIMRNVDATNYVKWGPDNAGSLVELGRLPPATNEFALFRLAPSGVTLRLQANGGTCKVEYELLEA